jgi:co-chaperonin GroES (HSP10)
MNIIPTNGNVFLEAIIGNKDFEKYEKAGFVIPERAKAHQLPNMGVVRFIDPAIKTEFKAGDTVIYNRHVQQFEFLAMPDGKKLTQIKADEIWAIVK